MKNIRFTLALESKGFEWLWTVIGPPRGGGSARKGCLFNASGIGKDRDFTRWSIGKGREICHLCLPYGFIKLRKRSIFVIDSNLNGSAFTALNNIHEKITQFWLAEKGVQLFCNTSAKCVTRVQTCNTSANYKCFLIGWKHKRNQQEPIRLELF